MKEWIFAVAFEAAGAKAPETAWGTVRGRTLAAAAARAVREATAAGPASSLVLFPRNAEQPASKGRRRRSGGCLCRGRGQGAALLAFGQGRRPGA